MYSSTKHYGHEVGLSCCFRQWRADSHCHFLHGYALAVTLEFESDDLDERNWVVDFGGLKDVKKHLEATFDHKLLIAQDDPELDTLTLLSQLGVADVIVVENTGCEAFAKLIYDFVDEWLLVQRLDHCPTLRKVTVAEHGGNSASFGE